MKTISDSSRTTWLNEVFTTWFSNLMEPCLLLHGALGSALQLDPLKESLEAAGVDAYSFNFSGHAGRPFSVDFGIEQFAHEAFEFLKENNIQKTDILGYSMGGYVAVWLCHLHPKLVGRVVTLGTKFDWSPESASREVLKMNPQKIQSKIPAFARILEHRHAPNDWKVLLQKTSEMMANLGNAPLLNESILKGIQTKILVVLGELDDMADRAYSQTAASWLPNGRFHMLPNTPHPIEKVSLTELVNLVLEKNG